jgi:hypothetical protein
MTTWEQFLDELELRILRSRSVTEAALDAWIDSASHPERNPELLPLGHFEAPQGLGPIPPELTERARNLVHDAREAEAALTERMNGVWDELRSSPARRADHHESREPVFLDQRA